MRATWTVAVGAVVLAIAGCASSVEPGTTAATAATLTGASPATISPGDVIATRVTTGGLCPTGPCSSRIDVRSDGSWVSSTTGASVQHRTGVADPQELATLLSALAQTRMDQETAFTGTCPIAYDGSEVTYTWQAADGPHRVSSCERVVDPGDPLVLALAAIADDPT